MEILAIIGYILSFLGGALTDHANDGAISRSISKSIGYENNRTYPKIIIDINEVER